MKRGLPGGTLGVSPESEVEEAVLMLHAGLDLGRRRLDVCLIGDDGEVVAQLAAPPDADGLRRLVERVGPQGRIRGVIESMTGARFVRDTLEGLGWEVLVADAQKVKGVAPLACKTDRIDAQVLAVLSHRDLVPAIWLPDARVRAEREQARFRLHLVEHRSMLKHRIHATLLTFGHPCPVSDLFGIAGRELLGRLAIPQPWRGTVDASLALIDDLDRQIDRVNRDLRASGADHPYTRLLLTVPGSGGCWRSRSPQRSATSAVSRRPRSSAATPDSARASISPAIATAAAR
jgi:transposase